MAKASHKVSQIQGGKEIDLAVNERSYKTTVQRAWIQGDEDILSQYLLGLTQKVMIQE